MRAVLVALTALLAGCSSPTAPSSPFLLNWSIPGPSTATMACGPTKPFPVLAGEPLWVTDVQDGGPLQGGVMAQWHTASGPDAVAFFTPVGVVHGLCLWAWVP